MGIFFKNFFPTDPLLKKHIHYFYFDSNPDIDFQRRYSFFPHVKTTLSFYKEAQLSTTGAETQITHSPGAPLLKILTQQRSVKTVVQKGPIKKIGIVFNPLGLNYFIDENYSDICSKETQLFHCNLDQGWSEALNNCFSLTNYDDILAVLESFLVSLYRPRQYEQLDAVIHHLTALNEMSIEEIARQNHLSHRSLNREFLKHLALSPELFRMILRFRYAVDKKILHQGKLKYTELAYESGYPDQSYMIRSFKKLTGQTPSQFFKSGVHLGNADTFWKLHTTNIVV